MVLSTTEWALRGVWVYGPSAQPHLWVPRVEEEGVETNDFNLEGVKDTDGSSNRHMCMYPSLSQVRNTCGQG